MNGNKKISPDGIRCTAKSLSGKPCRAAASKDGLCAIHADPQLAASLGRKSGTARRRSVAPPAPIAEPKTPADVRDVLGKVVVQLHNGSLDTKTATAIAYLSSTLLKAMDTADLEQRLTKIEAQQELRKWETDAEPSIHESIRRGEAQLVNTKQNYSPGETS